MGRISARAIIHSNGKFLLTRLKQYPTFWCLPGGGLEDGESIVDCLKRELVEELNVEPDVGELLYIHQIQDGEKHSGPGFFFNVKNSKDYLSIDLTKTKLGQIEIEEVGFKDISTVNLLPSFLKQELPEIYEEVGHLSHPTRIRISGIEG